MSRGFLSSPEKRCVQDRIWLPAIRKLYNKKDKLPLNIICLPGRHCDFLIRILKKGYANLETVTCVERKRHEALLIRGRLAELSAELGRAPVDIVNSSVYDFLTADDAVIGKMYDVVDLDIYGRLEEPDGDLLHTLAAAIAVQARSNVAEWVLLLTVEAASARGPIFESLRKAEARLTQAYGETTAAFLTPGQLARAGGAGLLQRYSALVTACVAHNAL